MDERAGGELCTGTPVPPTFMCSPLQFSSRYDRCTQQGRNPTAIGSPVPVGLL